MQTASLSHDEKKTALASHLPLLYKAMRSDSSVTKSASGGKLRICVEERYAGQRLDTFLRDAMEERLGARVSRSKIQHWIKAGFVRCLAFGKTGPSKHHITESGEIYELALPEFTLRRASPEDSTLVLVNKERELQAGALAPVRFVYRDQDLDIVHKQAGISVHPGPYQKNGKEVFLVEALLHEWEKEGLWKDRKPEDRRPGIVHRLDRDTEGLLLAAKHPAAQKEMMKLFAKGQVSKYYLAWIWGGLPQIEGRIELPLKRHPAHRLKMQVGSTWEACAHALSLSACLQEP